YPASMPVYAELVKNGSISKLIEAGVVIKTCFCGPCFGAGDTPANNAFSIRHSTRNFPNREGSKVQNGQISSVALMDARSIAATAANKGILTGADRLDVKIGKYKYYFDSTIYDKRVYDSKGAADASEELIMGPNIKDWPAMPALTDNLLLKVVSEIHDPVTTTDELIPSGETSSFRSNPLGLAEFALSRKDPEYVGRAKHVHQFEKAREGSIEKASEMIGTEKDLKEAWDLIIQSFPDAGLSDTGIGSTIFAVKPGDGSAREQAASVQKVLGGWANVANEYATKRYRSNLINWGMLPFLIKEGELPFANSDWLFIPGIKKALQEKTEEIKAYAVKDGGLKEFSLTLGALTDEERSIIIDGCLINHNRT
ncbi:MAG: hydratase, partial [Lachnospiraceae bacterium]|nr:hydratase [Lachnospiraceae bacterium]